MQKLFLLLNPQNDHMEWGMLPIEGMQGDLVQEWLEAALQYPLTAVCLSSYPADHQRFAANHLWRKPFDTIEIKEKKQVLWPFYAIEGSFGAEPPSQIEKFPFSFSYSRGKHIEDEERGVFDHLGQLQDYLKQSKIDQIILCGLSTGRDFTDSLQVASTLGIDCQILTSLSRTLDQEEWKILEKDYLKALI